MSSRGWEGVSLDQAQRMGRQPVSPKPSKYRNVKCVVGGQKFDSAREGQRWLLLLERQTNGEIRNLTRQTRFALMVNSEHIGDYIADFTYEEFECGLWRPRVEDSKGFRTALYKWKKKHFEAQLGIQIQEV